MVSEPKQPEPNDSEPNELKPIEPPCLQPTGPIETLAVTQPIVATIVSGPHWRFVHSSSLLFELLSRARQFIFPALLGIYSFAQGGWIFIGLGLIAVGVMFGFALLRYFTLQYCIADGELRVREGWIFRTYRTVPTQRIQNIDLVQNVLHRIFGVAEVRIETASGKEPEAILKVLQLSEVEWLREQVFPKNASTATEEHLDLASSSSPSASAARVKASGECLLTLSLMDLSLAGLISNRGWLLVPIAIGAMYESRIFMRFPGNRFRIRSEDIFQNLPQIGSWTSAIGAVTTLLVIFVALKLFSVGWYVLRFYGYELRRMGEDLRISCGLFTRVSATIPRKRIQFISIHRTWLGRKLGLASVRIETAGGGATEHENASQSIGRRWFVPVIREQHIPALMADIREGMVWEEDQFDWKPLSTLAAKRMSRIAIVVSLMMTLAAGAIWRPWGLGLGLIIFPVLLRVFQRKSKSMRYARAAQLIVYRSGMLTKKCSVTFLDKVQTLRISQTPFDRRWHMATLAVDTAAAGPADHRIAVDYLDADFAREEFSHLQLLSSKAV
jgi:putative membrane protein